MSMMYIIIPVTAVVAAIASLLAYSLNRASEPTTGKQIPGYIQPVPALLIIDIQEDNTGATARATSPYTKDSVQFITRINRLIGQASKSSLPVIYLQLEFSGFWGKVLSVAFHSGSVMKDTPGSTLDKRLLRIPGPVFSRPKWDAFSNPALNEFLIAHQVDELYLAGIDALYTVHSTARGALNRGYKVNVISDGVLLDSPSKRSKLVEKYQSDGINLVTSQSFLQNQS